MEIKTFCEEFQKATDKALFLQGHIARTYVPFTEKLGRIERIIKASMYSEVDGEEEFRMNTPARYALFTMTIVKLYTDVEFSDEAVFEAFDLICNYGVMKELVPLISAEYKEFDMLLSMAVDDRVAMEMDLVGFLNGKFKAAKVVMDTIADGVMEAVSEYVQNNSQETSAS